MFVINRKTGKLLSGRGQKHSFSVIAYIVVSIIIGVCSAPILNSVCDASNPPDHLVCLGAFIFGLIFVPQVLIIFGFMCSILYYFNRKNEFSLKRISFNVFPLNKHKHDFDKL